MQPKNDNDMERHSDLSESENSSEKFRWWLCYYAWHNAWKAWINCWRDPTTKKKNINAIDKDCFILDWIGNIDQNDEKYLLPDHPKISSSSVKTFAIDICRPITFSNRLV